MQPTDETKPVTYGVIHHIFEPPLSIEAFREWVESKPSFEEEWVQLHEQDECGAHDQGAG